MNIEFVGKHYNLDDPTRQFAQDKLQKVSRFVDEPVEIRVTLEIEKHRNIADLHIAHRHGVIQATEQAESMLDAIHLAVDKVEKQARRSRKKHIDRRRRAGRNAIGVSAWEVDILDRASLGPGAERRIVRTTHLDIKPMTVEEAALQLEGSKNDFVVFRDSTTDRINVLYKRKDQNYGLIAPEV